jgi:hypothetical protein
MSSTITLMNEKNMYTSKQHADFTEFKHFFKQSTENQQTNIPQKIHTLLLDWRENLHEFITACINERKNDFEDIWIYEIPKEYQELIHIEEDRRRTIQILKTENQEWKKKIAELDNQHKKNECMWKELAEQVRYIAYGEEEPISVPIKRQTNAWTQLPKHTDNEYYWAD